MKRSKLEPKPENATNAPYGDFVELCSGRITPPFDRALIAGILGERIAETLPKVGTAFGVGRNTPRKDWRPAGMPGETKSWNLVDITIWRLERAAKESERLKAVRNPGNERIKEIDLQLAELQLAKKKREEQEASGRTVDVFLARAELAAFLAVCRDQLLAMPGTLNPLLPTDCCEAVTELIKAESRKTLIHIVEGAKRAIERNTSEHYAQILRRIDEIERNDARNGSSAVD